MAPTATRKLRSCCYGRQEVERDSSLGPSSMELHGSTSGSFSSSNNSSSSMNSIAADKEDHNNAVGVLQTAGCSTPKGQRFRIPEILACPPAPMKPRVAPKLLSTRSSSAMPITFFASPDMEHFFFLAFQNVSPEINH